MDFVIISLFGFFGSDKKVAWQQLAECLFNLNQFNLLAAFCMAYQILSAGLIWSNGQYSGFLNFIWGIKWIIEGISNTVPGLMLHHKDFTFGNHSLYPKLLFIIFVGKMASFLLDPGLFRQNFQCRIGALYDCSGDNISYVNIFVLSVSIANSKITSHNTYT